MRIKHSVQIRIARDASMKKKLFYPEDGESEEVIDTWAKHNQGDIAIAAGGNEDLPTGDIDAVKGIYLEVDKEVKIKINGSADEIQMRKPNDGATDVARFFLEADITAVNVIAPASEAVTGIYVMWGDTA